tara:strand:+ start:1410 stop:1691 length:282 start_codon:yes stop_codon:yes gene_type:complete
MQKIIGGILIAFGVADFALSWLGVNLTPFLPNEIARFSPIAFILIGGAIMNAGSSTEGSSAESDAYDEQRTEKSGVELAEEAERKKKKRKKNK